MRDSRSLTGMHHQRTMLHWNRSVSAGRRASTVPRASAASLAGLKKDLAALTADAQRGLNTARTAEIMDRINALKASSAAAASNDMGLSATWRLLWTTEKETLFILKNAGFFGTAAGEVFQVRALPAAEGRGDSTSHRLALSLDSQVIDLDQKRLANVITFPPEGSFVVDSELVSSGKQRCLFNFRAAEIKLPKGRTLKLPPFGKGWYENEIVSAGGDDDPLSDSLQV